MEPDLEVLLEARKGLLPFYSPYAFAREVSQEEQVAGVILPKVAAYGAEENKMKLQVSAQGQNFVFLYEYLPWDSQYFHRACFKLFTVFYSQENAPALVEAIQVFISKILESGHCYCSAEIPPEDIFLIQCLTLAGIKLEETRLHYYKTDLQSFIGERNPVRGATAADIPGLSKVAATSRNNYDRLHADFAFSENEADDYLAAYATAAINGFCDHVLVPSQEGGRLRHFLPCTFPGQNSQKKP